MKPPYRVAFICTGNACRSQMAEALLRHRGGDRFEVSSAGTRPAGYIHPVATKTLAALNISLDGQRSKAWTEIADGPHDIVITLCDYAAGLPPPRWAGEPVQVHWSLPDPSFCPGGEEDRLAAGADVAATLQRWIDQLVAIPLDRLSREELTRELTRIADTL